MPSAPRASFSCLIRSCRDREDQVMSKAGTPCEDEIRRSQRLLARWRALANALGARRAKPSSPSARDNRHLHRHIGTGAGGGGAETSRGIQRPSSIFSSLFTQPARRPVPGRAPASTSGAGLHGIRPWAGMPWRFILFQPVKLAPVRPGVRPTGASVGRTSALSRSFPQSTRHQRTGRS